MSFAIPRATTVELVVFDILGRPVRRVVDGPMEAGAYRLFWDGRDQLGRRVASGVYVYRLLADSFSATGRMVLLR